MNNLSRNPLFDIDNIFTSRIFNNRVPAYRYSTPRTQKSSAAKNPAVDIKSLEESYQLIAELPGISKENIHVSIDDSILSIETKMPQIKNANNESQDIRTERYSGEYKRTFNLGEDVDQSSIKAQFENGLLILNIPKVKEVVQEPTKIEIH